ncbi:iridoid oxidase-like [Andrographis paniculata]|uniref:iridoid oxidase-like n=1 Tax=Andrographis paniculata TaxID=175694 RepID=UPI0021E9125B|nr:iridoid oxidase-like [Andrographis paniculata]
MEMVLISSIISILTVLLLFLKHNKSPGKWNTPPGPKGVPILGNLLQLGDLPHEAMQQWRKTYGPVIWLRLGTVNALVVQNAASAAELFKKHDVVFADRTVPDVLTANCFNQGALGLNPFGDTWRRLRRICSMEFRVNRRLNETVEMRHRIRDNMLRWILEESAASRAAAGSGAVQLSRCLFLMAFNVMGNLMLSRDLMEAGDPESLEFCQGMNNVLELSGIPNIADYFPFLKRMDPTGMKRKMKDSLDRTMRITSRFIEERLHDRQAGKARDNMDFLDVLLDYSGDGKDEHDRISHHNINVLITEMFFAGAETTSVSIEWGFTELQRNPRTFQKLREEIDRVVGLKRRVEEKDTENLPYLQAVVKEMLRLHPVLPLLIPRKTKESTTYLGYQIPKGTQVLVNAWAIGRDPDSWEDPLSFIPERFLESGVEYEGQHFEFIPFGSGRRMCVGSPLAQRVVPLALASLVQAFEWDLGPGPGPGPGPGVKAEDIDTQEKMGLTLTKKNPLFVIPKTRLFL